LFNGLLLTSIIEEKKAVRVTNITNLNTRKTYLFNGTPLTIMRRTNIEIPKQIVVVSENNTEQASGLVLPQALMALALIPIIVKAIKSKIVVFVS
jgi:hypothetical protein